MTSKKSKFFAPNVTPMRCCNCGKTVMVGDGYNVRGSGDGFRRGGWGTRHGGKWDRFTFTCEPGKLIRLRAEERKENSQ